MIEEEIDLVDEVLITGFDMDLSSILAIGESRAFVVSGSVGASFDMEVRNEDAKYYNFITKVFQAAKSTLKGEIYGKNGFIGTVVFPLVTDDDQYDISLVATRETSHSEYLEVRFGDSSLDINSTKGSNSLLITKVIYQYTALVLTLNPFSTTGAITGTAVNDTVSVSSGEGIDTQAFSMTFTVANDKALQVIKQPSHTDILAYVAPVIGSVPIAIQGEDLYPLVTATAKVRVGGVGNSSTIVLSVPVPDISVGDLWYSEGVMPIATQYVQSVTVVNGNVTQFVTNTAASHASEIHLTFKKRANYRWPINNYAHVLKAGFTVPPGGGNLSGSKLAKYSSTTTVFSGTPQEKTYINYEVEAVDTLSLKPVISNGEVVTQAGAIVFDSQQPLAIAGTTLKMGGYGQAEILNVFGYDVVFTDLAIALTPVTTTTTAVVNNSTSVPVLLVNGILDDVSTVSGIGINAALVDPTVDTGAGAVSGTGTLVLTAAQTLESGATLTFANAGLKATITGNIQILKAGTSSATLRFDIEKLLSIT